MLYQSFQAYSDLTRPAREFAGALLTMFDHPSIEAQAGHAARATRHLLAGAQLVELSGLTHTRPHFGITTTLVDGRAVPVREEVVYQTAFCSLVRFRKVTEAVQPRVLVVAPISGHFATLLRGTVRTLLPDHDVYLTDWHNVRDVPLAEGVFDLDAFVEHVMRCFTAIGPKGHVVAVCQPTVGVLAAVAVMAEAEDPASPRSMTLMAGPMDTRINPTEVNKLATSKPIEWFERNLIGRVPMRYKGAWRRVYPGFMQLAAFMSMNPDRHRGAFENLYQHLVEGETDKAAPIMHFYREYFAMMDLPAEFYLETVRAVFQEHLLPLGELQYRGRRIDPKAIRRTALLTIEGEKDDICSIGQTVAAHDLCPRIPPRLKHHHMQPGVGHYGVFNGRRWDTQIYPIVRNFIHAND